MTVGEEAGGILTGQHELSIVRRGQMASRTFWFPAQLLSGATQAEKESGTISKNLISDSKSLIVPPQPRVGLRTAKCR